jgi:uncharacterized lipoprotein YmbA
MRNIFLIVFVLLFGACSSKELYTLGDRIEVSKPKKDSREFIAVEKIELPTYFMDSQIYVKKNPYHLQKVEKANWISDIDVHLTNVLISYLQKAQNNPNIYPYPWSNIKKIDKKISVKITNFISYNGEVTLNATYEILDKTKRKTSNYFFSTKEKVEGESIEKMIEAMERAFFRLAEDINQKI